MANTKTPAEVTKDGVKVEGAYVEGGKTFDQSGNQITGDFTTQIGDKIFTSGDGGGGPSSSGSGSSSGSSGSSSGYNPSSPPHIGNLSDVPADKIVYGNVIVNGVLEQGVPLYDGVFYDKATGKPYSTVHTGDGLYGPDDYLKQYKIDENGIPTGYFVSKNNGESYSSSGGGGGGSYSPPVSYPPPKIDFNEPIPTFKTDVKRVKKYIYYFGLDQIEAKNVQIDKTSCIVSPYIEIGQLSDEDYIQLDVSYYSDINSNVEFYIIDGEKEVPILPLKDTTIENESLFVNLFTRFNIDKTKPVTIKNKGATCNKSYENIISNINLWEDSSNRYEYTISYTPLEGKVYRPINTKIQIKITLRCYEVNDNPPFVETVSIRKYMKKGIWI